MRVLSCSAQRSPVAKWRMPSPVTPGMFAVRLCCLVRSNESQPRANTQRWKNCVLFCDSIGAFFDIKLITTWQHDCTADAIFKQISIPATFVIFSQFSDSFCDCLWLTLHPRIACFVNLSAMSHFQRSLKCEILKVSCTCVLAEAEWHVCWVYKCVYMCEVC